MRLSGPVCSRARARRSGSKSCPPKGQEAALKRRASCRSSASVCVCVYSTFPHAGVLRLRAMTEMSNRLFMDLYRRADFFYLLRLYCVLRSVMCVCVCVCAYKNGEKVRLGGEKFSRARESAAYRGCTGSAHLLRDVSINFFETF